VHCCTPFLLVLLDVIAELGIHQRLIASQLAFVDILGPKQLLGYAVSHQLLSDAVIIRQPFVAVSYWRIKDLLQVRIGYICGQRPGKAMFLSPL
jgi:hypothetical protein